MVYDRELPQSNDNKPLGAARPGKKHDIGGAQQQPRWLPSSATWGEKGRSTKAAEPKSKLETNSSLDLSTSITFDKAVLVQKEVKSPKRIVLAPNLTETWELVSRNPERGMMKPSNGNDFVVVDSTFVEDDKDEGWEVVVPDAARVK